MTINEIELIFKPIIHYENLKISNSKLAYKLLMSTWNLDTIELYEEFKLILLNNSNLVLGIYSLSKGGTNQVIVDIRLLFAIVLKSGAVGFITVHNHPSGNLKPSSSDFSVFNKIKEACSLLDLTYIDNLIISKSEYFSFSDEL